MAQATATPSPWRGTANLQFAASSQGLTSFQGGSTAPLKLMRAFAGADGRWRDVRGDGPRVGGRAARAGRVAGVGKRRGFRLHRPALFGVPQRRRSGGRPRPDDDRLRAVPPGECRNLGQGARQARGG